MSILFSGLTPGHGRGLVPVPVLVGGVIPDPGRTAEVGITTAGACLAVQKGAGLAAPEKAGAVHEAETWKRGAL